MLNNTINVTAAPCGAAFPGAGSPWTMLQAIGLSAVGMNHVRTPFPVPVMTQKQLVALATGLPTATDNRKHNVYKTRVNAGGDGASGPHPEREPA